MKKLDRLVKNRAFLSRSKIIQDAVEEKLKKLDRHMGYRKKTETDNINKQVWHQGRKKKQQ